MCVHLRTTSNTLECMYDSVINAIYVVVEKKIKSENYRIVNVCERDNGTNVVQTNKHLLYILEDLFKHIKNKNRDTYQNWFATILLYGNYYLQVRCRCL